MRSILFKITVVNVLIAIGFLVAFYFISFLSGYGSNASYLPQEKKLFIKFVTLHFIGAIFFLYKYKHFTIEAILATIVAIATIYLLAAWQFEYLV